MVRKCCVKDCASSAKRAFKLPQANVESKKFLQWLAATGNTKLLTLSPEVLRNKVICIKHFEAKYFLPKKLSTAALPTLHLPESIDVTSYVINSSNGHGGLNSPVKHSQNEQIRKPLVDFSNSGSYAERVLHPLNGEDFFQNPLTQHACVSVADAKNNLNNDDIDVNIHTAERMYSCPEKQSEITGIQSMSSESTLEQNISGTVRVDPLETIERSEIDCESSTGKLLSFFNLSRKKNLTSKENKLYNLIAQLRKSIRKMQKHNVSLRERLRQAKSFAEDGPFDQLSDLPETSRDFLLSHLRNPKLNRHHRRYSIKDKVFALALYQRNSAAYRFMQEIFTLPSIESLHKLIRQIPIQPGFSNHLFESLCDKLDSQKDPRTKYCILTFDKTSLDPTLKYNSRTGTIEGFIDTGHERKAEIANHAMVWMLKGVKGEWKQPIFYSLCNATSKWEDIVRTFKDIVREANKYGLKVISSICDQAATNVKAVKKMIEFSKGDALSNGTVLRDDVIVIDSQVIVPLFDVPHLIKCIRNNFLTKAVKFVMKDGITRVANWSHIETAYEIGKSMSFSLLRKLTDYHIYQDKIRKMSVKYCTQVFSHRVAATIHLMSVSGSTSLNGLLSMPPEGRDTAVFVKVMNDLFDSLNGGLKQKTSTIQSNDSWNEYIDFIRSMEFVPTKSDDKRKPKILANFILTIQGFKLLKKSLYNLGFNEFSTRVFNQDAVEKFLGQIKQHGMRDNRPNAPSFTVYYKTLILKNFIRSKRSRFNCESDEVSDFIVDIDLEQMQNFVTTTVPEKAIEFPKISKGRSMLPFKEFRVSLHEFKAAVQPFTKCTTCYENVFTMDGHLDDIFYTLDGIALYYFSHFIHIDKFGKTLIKKLLNVNVFQFRECEHSKELHQKMIKKYVERTIIQYLKKITEILTGDESLLEGTNDVLMLEAEKMYKNRTCRRVNKTKSEH